METKVVMGTDSEIFGSEIQTRIKRDNGKGRPRLNRLVAYRFLLAPTPYSSRYIKSALGIKGKSNSSISMMRKEIRNIVKFNKEGKSVEEISKELNLMDEEVELVLSLILDPSIINTDKLDKMGLDFDEECRRAMGFSFKDWMKDQMKNWKYIFNFCERVWSQIWDKPSLVIVKDRKFPLGDQLCQEWLKVFGGDKKRIRNRKKSIRYIFRFLGREDLCNRHLRMPKDRNPIIVRDIPELTLPSFPQKLEETIDLMTKQFGSEARTLLTLKTVTQMRTGSRKSERDIWGLSKGEGKSWIVMDKGEGGIQLRGKIFSKKGEEWWLSWIPSPVLKDLYEIYEEREQGEKIFNFHRFNFLRSFGDISEKVIGRRLRLHDLRKVSATWFYVMGVPLEITAEIGVGWKDLNTLKDHYIQFRRLLSTKERQEYRDEIPEWFKEGLKEIIE